MIQVNNHAKGFFQHIQSDGTIIRGFSCCCCDDCIAMRAMETQEAEYDYDHRPLEDPNRRVTPRNVHRELGDRVPIINLGMKVNRIKSRFGNR